MNKTEFNKVMDELDISKLYVTKNNEYDEKCEVYVLNNLGIYFNGKGYSVITGGIPLEIVNIVYDRYLEYFCQTNLKKVLIQKSPNNFAVDKKYREEIKKYFFESNTTTECLEKCRKAKERLIKREGAKKEIETIHIYSKEDLLFILEEMKKYFHDAQNLNQVSNQENKINIKRFKLNKTFYITH